MMQENIKQLQATIQKLRDEGKFREMIETCYRLLQAARETGNYRLQMEAYAYYALGFYKIGEVKDAFYYIEKHAVLCEDYGAKEDYMYSYHIFYLLYEYTENYEKATQVLETSIELGEQLERCDLVSENLSELGHVLSMAGEYERALVSGKRGAQIAVMSDSYRPYLVMKATLAVAQAYLGNKNFDAAEALLQTVIRDSILKDYAKERTKCYRLFARLQLLRHDKNGALASLEIANASAKASYNFKEQKEIQEAQIEIYRQLGEYEKGFHLQEQHIQLLEDRQRQENANAAMRLEMQVKLRDLEKQANTDFLTEVLSRRSLEKTANDWLQDSAIYSENIVCIAFDIDNLKTLNDRYGHPFGDQVIRQIAQTCNNMLRRSDITGRIGGDEFVSIIRNISLEEGCRKAHHMLEAVREMKIEHEGKPVELSLSVGIAESGYGAITEYSKLYRSADSALYRAKNNGKNQVCCGP